MALGGYILYIQANAFCALPYIGKCQQQVGCLQLAILTFQQVANVVYAGIYLYSSLHLSILHNNATAVCVTVSYHLHTCRLCTTCRVLGCLDLNSDAARSLLNYMIALCLCCYQYKISQTFQHIISQDSIDLHFSSKHVS